MSMPTNTISTAPALPAYILRGHAASIHAVRFIRRNARLLTGDADGWVILWNLTTKRPAAVWRAHTATILGLDAAPAAEGDHIITHGRDAHLRVWQLRPQDEAALDTVPPVDDCDARGKQPWLLHSLLVNTLNFCSFASCAANEDFFAASAKHSDADIDTAKDVDSIHVAVPGVVDGTVAVYGLPSEGRISTVPKAEDLKTGMVMALALVPSASTLHLIAGYESGMTAVFALDRAAASHANGSGSGSADAWQRVYASHPHAQPLLSLCPLPPECNSAGSLTYFSSGADDVVASHVVRVPSQPSAPSSGSHPTAPPTQTSAPNPPSLLSAALASSVSVSPSPSTQAHPDPTSLSVSPASPTTPSHAVHTKHAGQQSLAVRSDGRLLATGGWDGRARVYSTRSLAEVAVLKWHAAGCYSVDFAAVLREDEAEAEREVEEEEENDGSRGPGHGNDEGIAVARKSGAVLARVRKRRQERVQGAHLIAVGSKDGKVSLWEVY